MMKPGRFISFMGKRHRVVKKKLYKCLCLECEYHSKACDVDECAKKIPRDCYPKRV